MMRNARLLGIVVGAAAVGLFVSALAWLYGARGDGVLSGGGFALGLFLILLATLPLGAMAVLLISRGTADTAAQARAERTRKLLNLVLTKGKVSIGEAVLALEVPREDVRAILMDAVGRGVFSGYVNWNEGILYAREAAAGVQPCPNCGGTIEIAGRGVFQCPYCGTEIFQAVGEGQAAIHGVTPPAPVDGGTPDVHDGSAVAFGASEAPPPDDGTPAAEPDARS